MGAEVLKVGEIVARREHPRAHPPDARPFQSLRRGRQFLQVLAERGLVLAELHRQPDRAELEVFRREIVEQPFEVRIREPREEICVRIDALEAVLARELDRLVECAVETDPPQAQDGVELSRRSGSSRS